MTLSRRTRCLGLALLFDGSGMWPSRSSICLVALSLLGCGPAPKPVATTSRPPTETEIRQAALAAVAALPWNAPSDTLIVEPRIVSLPTQSPAFFVPSRRALAATLTQAALGQGRLPDRVVTLGSWQECSARRDNRAWVKGRVACVALGIAGLEGARADAMTFALLTLTPANGLTWPKVRVTRPRDVWLGRVMTTVGR